MVLAAVLETYASLDTGAALVLKALLLDAVRQ
jgi:hypothetical protein